MSGRWQLIRMVAMCLTVALVVPALASAKAKASEAGVMEGIGARPMLFDIDVRPGRTVTTAISITNSTSATQELTLATEDVSGSKSDPAASPILLGSTVNSSISGASWIAPQARSIRVASGDTQDLEVKVSAPEGATGGHYAALTVSSAPMRIGNGVTANSRVAVLFMMNAGGTPPPEIVIQDVVVTEEGETIIEYVNEGSTGTKPDATVTFEDPITGRDLGTGKTTSGGDAGSATGDGVGSGSSSCTYALPGAKGRCTVTVHEKGPSLLRGGEVVLTNDGRTAKAPVPTEWTSEGSSLLLPLIGVAMLAMYFGFLRKHRRLVGAGRDGDDDDHETLLREI